MTTGLDNNVLQQLTQLSLALTTEKDHGKLLCRILDGCMELANADGGTLYTLNEIDENQLDFTVIRNGSLGISDNNPDIPSIELFDLEGESAKLVVAQTFILEETINILDAYDSEAYDFSGTHRFDEQFHYHSKSFLCVPLKDHQGDMVGVLQLINKLDHKGEIVPFDTGIQEIIESLASLASSTLTKRRLIDAQRELMESFVQIIARTIDHKSPVTGKHCENVPTIAMILAKAVCESTEGVYSDKDFTEEELYELNMAAWMHDCGKITSPEYIIEKGTKLQLMSDRFDLVENRFTLFKQHLYIDLLEAQSMLTEGQFSAKQVEYMEQCAKLEEDLEFLRVTNAGGEFLAEECVERIAAIGRQSWVDHFGQEHNLLTDEEVSNLQIRKGTLTDEERNIMRDHILVTLDMLEALPFPKHLKDVPSIAGNHHECLNGKGYPRGLMGDDLTLQARIMCIADIFEALTSPDRPYKNGMMLSQSLTIIGRMVEDGNLDRDLFDLFVRSGAYMTYAEQHVHPKQVDEVDLDSLPGLQRAEI